MPFKGKSACYSESTESWPLLAKEFLQFSPGISEFFFSPHDKEYPIIFYFTEEGPIGFLWEMSLLAFYFENLCGFVFVLWKKFEWTLQNVPPKKYVQHFFFKNYFSAAFGEDPVEFCKRGRISGPSFYLKSFIEFFYTSIEKVLCDSCILRKETAFSN